MHGKFLIDREIFESDLWEKPPYYFKIWVWILGKANWKEIKKGGKIYHRGEFKTDYAQIMEENKWRIGWRTETLTKDSIFKVLDFLRKTQRIQTSKTTKGLWVKVLNYDYLQALLKDDGNNESNKEHNNEAIDFQQGKEKEKINKEKEREENLFPSFSSTQFLNEGETTKLRNKLLVYFKEQCQKIVGPEPEIRTQDIRVLDGIIRRYETEQIKDIMCWYLDSKKEETYGCNLRVALSASTINQYFADTREEQKLRK